MRLDLAYRYGGSFSSSVRFFASSLKFSDSLCLGSLRVCTAATSSASSGQCCKNWMGQRVPRVICGAECMRILRWPIWSELEGVARVRSALKKPGQWTSDVSHLESAEFATIDIHAHNVDVCKSKMQSGLEQWVVIDNCAKRHGQKINAKKRSQIATCQIHEFLSTAALQF